MTTTFRNALLALVLIIGLAVKMEAQDRYEYATLAYSGVGKTYQLSVSTSGSFSIIDGKITEGNVMQNSTPIVAKVEEMSKDNWEIYNTTFSPGVTYYYLKRKAK